MDLDGVELAKEPETVVQYLKTEYPDVKVYVRLIPWAIELVRLKHCSLTGYFESRGNNTAIWLVSSDFISGGAVYVSEERRGDTRDQAVY